MTSTFLILLLVWVCVSLAFLLACHGRTLRALWLEPTLGRPVIIIESDDWGVGPRSDAHMLTSIAATLAGVLDADGRAPVMTLGLVVGHPDGPAILASGLAKYRRRVLDEPSLAPIVTAIRAGCDAGVFALQWHGLEHCWPDSLVACARRSDELKRWLADPSARSEALPPALQTRWLDTSELPSRPLERSQIDDAVGEEAAVLARVFGRVPTVAVPNTFVWNDDVERAWCKAGVTCIVTPGRRFEGRDASGALAQSTRTIRNGDRSAGGAVYVVRDDYFEPNRGHRAEQVWQAVAKKRLLGRPALFETHRENFIAAPETASAALAELERALRGLIERHPNGRFMSTAELAVHLSDPASPLRERAVGARLRVFLRRIAHEASCARFLKYSGLGMALRLLLWAPHSGIRV